jgi:tetratricopeptide (TPR) repeat protein
MNRTFGIRSSRRCQLFIAGTILAACLAVLIGAQRYFRNSPAPAAEVLLAKARVCLRQKEYDEAERLAALVDRRHRLWASAGLVAGEAATRAGRLQSAVDYYQSIPRDDSPAAVVASLAAGEVLRTIGRLAEAEREYLYVLIREPADLVSHRRLAFLYGVSGQRWKAAPHSMVLVRSGLANWEDLFFIGDVERPWDQSEYLRQCAKDAPDDELVRLGMAALAIAEGRSADARRILEEIVEKSPQSIAAHAMLGELFVDADDETFASWHARLPAAADEDPDIWFHRGVWAGNRNAHRVAARCFWETIRRAPNHRRGTYRLGQALAASGEAPGPDFADRSRQLFELASALTAVQNSHGQDSSAVRRVTELLEEGGRLCEAWAWSVWATQAFREAAWSWSTVSRLSPLLSAQMPQTVDRANLALRYDLSGFPDHKELFRQTAPGSGHRRIGLNQSGIRFEEETDAGIEFIYFNGSDPLPDDERSDHRTAGSPVLEKRVRVRTRNRTRIFETNGGGVAVVDFDGDNWPDLYFTQGAEWRHGAQGPTFSAGTTDRLYRNLEGRAFVDVTRSAGLVDGGYGQGCAAGDFNNDGFPDIYVANIGGNRLHRNNGDGTFFDVTAAGGLVGDDWTASCVIVDLNADGLPDLFDVNYLTGEHVYDALCENGVCSSDVFEGVPARLHINRGDGTFEFIPHATPESNSKGLGVVALDLHCRGRPSLFVANDKVPNFLLRNSPEGPYNVRLVDEGFVSGLAYNGDGFPVASMGIAADDANGDGLIDFFVTDFQDEADVLFLQESNGIFVDGTSAAGLRMANRAFVGWGTQFLDADCDGEPDLVATNGHVDDFRQDGGEYQQRPQFYRNLGGGRFIELSAPEIGAFFAGKYLGRGLARLDWNRDGRMDFVVSNIGSRASLVTNRSTGAGHFLCVRLHARTTARDAIGSVVEVEAGGRRWSKQLVAGDGYMASNERLLQFGLGQAGAVALVRILWPSGETTTLRNLPVDSTIELVEGAVHGVLWRGSQPGPLEEARRAVIERR